MVAPVTLPPSNTPGDFAGNPVLFDQKKMEWYLWFQAACPQFNTLASDLQGEILAAAEVAAAASATAAANAVLTSKVTGPASTTDNTIARFDGPTGKVVQSSAATLDDSGNLAINGLTATGAINLQGSSTFPTTGMFLRSGDNQLKIIAGSAGIAFSSQSGGSTWATLDASGNVTPGANGTQAFGSTSLRWSQVWCTAGAFNTSDARLKTAVKPFTTQERAAAVALSKEVGLYQWLESVEAKGADKARQHVGVTVQRAAEVLESFGLDPWRYGFMSYDKWDDVTVDHPAVEAVDAAPAVLDDKGDVITPAVEAIEAQDAWTEVTLKAGESYAFRYDQLNLFIAQGLLEQQTAMQTQLDAQNAAMQLLAARLAALEAA